LLEDKTIKTPKEEQNLLSNNLGKSVTECTEISPNIEANSDKSNIIDRSDGKNAFAKTIDSNNMDAVISLGAHFQELFYNNHERSCPDECQEKAGTCLQQDAKSYESELVPASADDDGRHSVEGSDKNIFSQNPILSSPREQDEKQSINQCDHVLIFHDIIVDDLGRTPSTLDMNKPSLTASNLHTISDAQGIRDTKGIAVSETIISHARNDEEATFVPHQSNIETILSMNTGCNEVTPQDSIENIDSIENSLQNNKDSVCLMMTGFQTVQQELIAELKLREKCEDHMKVSTHTNNLSSDRDLSPCSKLQKTWEMSAEMKAKPKKLKTPDIFLSKKNEKKSVSTNMQTTIGHSKNHVSELVAMWSKDAVSPSKGSEDATESKIRQTPVTNKITNNNSPSRTLRLNKSKKIQPSQTDNDSYDEKSTHHGEPLSFLNEMLG
jgi:hypothetical protein